MPRSRWRSALAILGLCLSLALTTACGDEWDKLTSSGGGSDDADEKATEVSDNDEPDDEESENPPEPVVHMDPGRATLRGAARNKCWDNCYWVVWCGHEICDGSWTWTFPESGTYEITWLDVKEKCAGSPAYELRINGDTVTSDRIPQHGSCGGCDGGGRWVDRSLGTFDIEEGDEVTLWVENDFACGIDGPGAYAAHDALRADLR